MGKPSIFLIFKVFLLLSFESFEVCLSCTHVSILSLFSLQRGKRIVKQLPSSTTLSTSTLPFMASINSLTSASFRNHEGHNTSGRGMAHSVMEQIVQRLFQPARVNQYRRNL